MTTPGFNSDRLTLRDLDQVLRFRTTVTAALAELPPSLVIRLELLPLAELLGVTDRWTTQ